MMSIGLVEQLESASITPPTMITRANIRLTAVPPTMMLSCRSGERAREARLKSRDESLAIDFG
jgi:hypothetical protein